MFGDAQTVVDRAIAATGKPVKPAALTRGTVVELRDLFFATPARLKFLRSDRAEAQAITEVVRRLAEEGQITIGSGAEDSYV